MCRQPPRSASGEPHIVVPARQLPRRNAEPASGSSANCSMVALVISPQNVLEIACNTKSHRLRLLWLMRFGLRAGLARGGAPGKTLIRGVAAGESWYNVFGGRLVARESHGTGLRAFLRPDHTPLRLLSMPSSANSIRLVTALWREPWLAGDLSDARTSVGKVRSGFLDGDHHRG